MEPSRSSTRRIGMRKQTWAAGAAVVTLTACAYGLSGSPSALPSPTRDDFRTSETKHGMKFWPRSAPVATGVEYSFSTGHCGLDYLTDFDGSFWHRSDPNNSDEAPFFSNEDSGTMTLVSHDRAIYKSSSGRRVALLRDPGPIVLRGACA
jgi:hypothetical protein